MSPTRKWRATVRPLSGKNMAVPVGAGKNQFVKLRIRSDEKSKVYAFDKLMIHARWGCRMAEQFSNLDKAAGLHGSTDYGCDRRSGVWCRFHAEGTAF